MDVQGHFVMHKISDSLITGSCCSASLASGTTSFTSSPVSTPDLLPQGRLTVVLWSFAPHTVSGRVQARTGTCPGVWRRRSRDVVQAKQTWRSNVATGATVPLSKGELWFSINTILLALTFSFPGSYILLTSCVLESLFVTELRSLPDSKRLAVPLNSVLESVILFEKPVLGTLHGY